MILEQAERFKLLEKAKFYSNASEASRRDLIHRFSPFVKRHTESARTGEEVNFLLSPLRNIFSHSLLGEGGKNLMSTTRVNVLSAFSTPFVAFTTPNADDSFFTFFLNKPVPFDSIKMCEKKSFCRLTHEKDCLEQTVKKMN